MRHAACLLLDAAAFATMSARRTAALGCFGWVARPAPSQTSGAYHLLEAASPTPDGSAGRRYGRLELTQIRYAPSPHAVLSVSSAPQSPSERAAVGAIGCSRQLSNMATMAPGVMNKRQCASIQRCIGSSARGSQSCYRFVGHAPPWRRG